ncbi:MAG: ROK family protein [Mariprofundales bacterium]
MLVMLLQCGHHVISDFYIGMDIGGTNVRAALFDRNGNIHKRISQQLWFSKLTVLDNDSAIEYIANKLVDCVKILQQNISQGQVHAVGIGFPGFFQDGKLLSSPNIPQLIDVPLATILQQYIGLPVVVENDALCAAFGEYKYGAGKNRHCFAHITLGTGVGGGLIINGKPFSGARGMSMEVGHLTVDITDNAALCGCGKKGCLEAYASATAVLADYQQNNSKQVNSVKDIYALAQNGDLLARQSFIKAGHKLGFALAQMANLLDADCISVGGGMAAAWEYFAPAMNTMLQYHLIPPHREYLQIIPAKLADDAGLIGAYALAKCV